jgi:hypothetical protein
MKLSHRAFIELNNDLIQTFYDTATLDKWQGHKGKKGVKSLASQYYLN